MTGLGVFAALALAAPPPAMVGAKLPFCPNRVIREVVKRAGCTVGDTGCWNRGGGTCMDWVLKRRGGGARDGSDLVPIRAEDVRPGDVAVFMARIHFALVDRVVRDASGRPVAVDLSEYNHGTCWVDEDALVTERYGLLDRRRGVPLAEVDGGFVRAPGAR